MSPDDPCDVADLLASGRRLKGLTQEALAEATGVSVRTIRDLERGRVRAPQRATLAALADALGLSDGDRHRLAAVPPPRLTSTSSPAELPPVVGDLTGRHAEVEGIRAHGRAVVVGRREAPTLLVLHGPAGVGKTSLAVAAASALCGDFPGGQLFVDLRGGTATPSDPAEVLAGFLRSLGVPPSGIPTDLDGRSGLFRTLTRRLALLVVLDNAVEESQVRPLLPAGSRCLTLTTSRRPLTGLAATELVGVGLLTADDARDLLTAVVGARVHDEPGPVCELVELCDGLPLALRIAANRLAGRAGWQVAHLVAHLRDERRRLSGLTAGDLGVRAALDVTANQLDPVTEGVFRCASLIPGPTFAVDLAAVVAGVDEGAAVTAAEALVDAGLLTPAGARYRFHDLVRLYAREHTDRDPGLRRDAVDRMVTWLLARTVEAGRALDVEGSEQQVQALGLPEVRQRRDTAAAWLDVEGPAWLAALQEAARRGRHREVADVARALHWYSDAATHRHPWVEVFELGAASARQIGDVHGEVVLLNFTGWALYFCVERHDDARTTLDRALALARRHDDVREQGWALVYLAAVTLREGRPEDAVPLAREAVDAFDRVAHTLGHESALCVLGMALTGTGACHEAFTVHQAVLASYRVRKARGALGTEMGEATVTLAVAGDLAGLGRVEEALTAFDTARSLFRRQGSVYGEGVAAFRQGVVLADVDPPRARSLLHAAIPLFAEVGAVSWELRARQALDGVGADVPAPRAPVARPTRVSPRCGDGAP